MNTKACNKLVKADVLTEVKKQYPDHSGLYRMRKGDLCNMITGPPCEQGLGGLKNQANSCYIDSILVALLHHNEGESFLGLIKRSLRNKPEGKQIREQVRALARKIHNGEVTSCSGLRGLLARFNSDANADWLRDQMEPMDFLRFLKSVLQIPKTLDAMKTIYGTNSIRKQPLQASDKRIISQKNIKMSFDEFAIPSGVLYHHVDVGFVDLKEYLAKYVDAIDFDSDSLWKPNKENGPGYKRRMECVQLLSGGPLLVHINRLVSDDEKLQVRIEAPMYIKLKGNTDRMHLRSIVVHYGSAHSGHYVAYLRCKGQWFLYDDLDYKRLMPVETIPNSAWKNCTELYYV